MPTYEYKCNACGYQFDQFQSMHDKPLKTCPQCGGQVKRLLGVGGAVICKGSADPTADYSGISLPACGRDRPCCGRDIPCDNKPCK
mgnify:CR=1 FL=1